jgi:hypothetical protein
MVAAVPASAQPAGPPAVDGTYRMTTRLVDQTGGFECEATLSSMDVVTTPPNRIVVFTNDGMNAAGSIQPDGTFEASTTVQGVLFALDGSFDLAADPTTVSAVLSARFGSDGCALATDGERTIPGAVTVPTAPPTESDPAPPLTVVPDARGRLLDVLAAAPLPVDVLGDALDRADCGNFPCPDAREDLDAFTIAAAGPPLNAVRRSDVERVRAVLVLSGLTDSRSGEFLLPTLRALRPVMIRMAARGATGSMLRLAEIASRMDLAALE